MSVRRGAWYLAALLAVAHLLSFVDRYLMSLVLEPVKAHFALDDAMLGLLNGTGFALFYSLAALPFGWLADRVDRRRLVAAALVCWSLATALCGLATAPWQLFVARALLGLGEAALVPPAVSMLAAAFPRRQLGRAMSLFTGGASLGRGGALVAGGAVLAALVASGGLALPIWGRLEPWQGVFVLFALPGLALALLVLTTLREPGREAGAAARPARGEALAHVRAGLPAYALHSAAVAALGMVGQTFGGWAPAFTVRTLGVAPAQAGAMLGAVLLVAAPLGHLAGGALTDWLQARGSRTPATPVMVLSLIVAATGVIGFAAQHGAAPLLACFALATFGAAFGMPAALAGLQMLTPDRLRGQVTAGFLAVTALVGLGLGPPFVGLASDLLGGPGQLGPALQLVLGLVAALGIALTLAGRAPFARALSRNGPPTD